VKLDIIIIPARSGSKGVPDKNIRLLAGKPLIAYSIAIASLINNIDRVIVSTDSDQYASIAREYGAEVPFLRPPEISGDNSGDYDFIKHALDWMQDNEGYQPEHIIHLRPTTPLREVSYVESAMEAMKRDNQATALRSIHEMSESAYKTFEIDEGYLKSICSRSSDIEAANRPRQKFRKTYDANGYVDIIKTSYIRASRKIHGDRVIGYITPRVFEVHTLEDFQYLEYQIARNPVLIKKLFK